MKTQRKERTCATCPRPVRSQIQICRHCEIELRRRLGNQAAYQHDLEMEYTRQTHKVEVLRARGLSFPILFEAQASKLLARQTRLLIKWMTVVLSAHPRLHRPSRWTVPIMGGYLAGNLSVLRRKREAGEMLRDLRDLDSDIVALIDLDPMRTAIYVGPCPQKLPADGGTQEWCSGQVAAFVPADEKAAAYMHCAACQTNWPSWQWSRAGARIIARAADLERQRDMARQISRLGVA